MNKTIKKVRADILLIERGLSENIIEAKKMILAGNVRIGADRVIRKTTELLPLDAEFNVQQLRQYVSRGAFKLLPAFEKHLPGSLDGLVALDVGASTGGFTDLMLQKNIVKVYAVDTGTGQLHYKLRNNPKVVCMEKTNARHFNKNSLPEKVNLLTMDVSFISVTKILPSLQNLFYPDSLGFVLVKPQFELPRDMVEKGGVVRSEQARLQCVKNITDFINNELNWNVFDMMPSPIKGPKGNQEYILCINIV